jgi:arylsulfatase A-like enzyme
MLLKLVLLSTIAAAVEVLCRALAPFPFAFSATTALTSWSLYALVTVPALLIGRWRPTRRLLPVVLALPFALLVLNLAEAEGMRSRAELVALALAALGGGTLLTRLRAPHLIALATVAIAVAVGALVVKPMRHADTADISVLLIVLDTTSATRLSTYGYEKPTSPNLTEFARRGALYERAISTAPWTIPAHASIFTGAYVSELGFDGSAFHREDWPGTIAGDMESIGLEAHAISANPIFFGWPDTQRDFRRFWSAHSLTRPAVLVALDKMRGTERFRSHGAEITTLALDWLDRVSPRRKPWFLYLNYLDPHAPYEPPDAERERFAPGRDPSLAEDRTEAYNSGRRPLTEEVKAAISDLYDGEVAAADAALGDLLRGLRARGFDESNLLIIVTADHGEGLGAHGFVGHLLGLPEEILHVPLVLSGPGVRPGTVSEPVQPVQLRATIRSLLGLAPLPAIASALPPWGPAPELLVTEHPQPTWYFDDFANLDYHFTLPPEWKGDWIAVERGGIKIVAEREAWQGKVYDLRQDPGEHAPAPLVAGESLIQAYQSFAAQHTTPSAVAKAQALPEGAKEHLRAIGYMN